MPGVGEPGVVEPGTEEPGVDVLLDGAAAGGVVLAGGAEVVLVVEEAGGWASCAATGPAAEAIKLHATTSLNAERRRAWRLVGASCAESELNVRSISLTYRLISAQT